MNHSNTTLEFSRTSTHLEVVPDPERIALLIPCYNEEVTIAEVIRQFREQLPNAEIYVCDNNSSDRTAEYAVQAGATVLREKRRGKGYAVQTLFRNIDADVYVLVDGDGTYPAKIVNTLIEPIRRGEADIVIGSRLHQTANSEFRFTNRLGNRLFRFLLNRIFGVRLTDLLSGYRVFGRRPVRGIPLFGGGFETETEMTIKALERGFSIVEIPVNLKRRPPGSHSKIRVTQDGLIILRTILRFFRDYKPLTFFGGVGLGIVVLGCVPGTWVIVDYLQSGLVPRLPSAVLSVGLVLSGMISIVVGLILHTMSRRFQELECQLRSFAEGPVLERPRKTRKLASPDIGPVP